MGVGMKSETKEKLLDFMRSKKDLNINDVQKLFEIYSIHEITCVDDFYKDHAIFSRFIVDNMNVFSDFYTRGGLIADVAFGYIRPIRQFLDQKLIQVRHQERFAESVEYLVGQNQNVRILEVGSGEIPYSSILLGRKGYDITSIDNIALPQECLGNMGVKVIRQSFDRSTSVSGFDVVVGRKPCMAIRAIAGGCSQEKIPYYVRLCGCYAPDSTIKSWRQLLKFYDKDVKYKNAYMYNMDNAKFQSSMSIEEIIEMDSEKEYVGEW